MGSSQSSSPRKTTIETQGMPKRKKKIKNKSKKNALGCDNHLPLGKSCEKSEIESQINLDIENSTSALQNKVCDSFQLFIYFKKKI